MQEIICIHIGQGGIQISNAAWELFCIEHGIEANGQLKESLGSEDSQAFTTFFSEAPNGQYIPRALSVDLEPTVVDEVRTGSYRHLFHPEQLLNVFEDGSNNFARAHFSIGKAFIDTPMNVLRRLTENCDSLQGFFILNSHGGGTGSGFTSLIVENVNVEYAKSLRFQISIFPSVILSSSVVEPYNAVLLNKSDVENSDVTTLINNEAIFGMCHDLLSISRPTFSNINRVVSHCFSDLTASLRFENSLCSNFSQMTINLIPYPRIHFPLLSHAPLLNGIKADHEASSTQNITRSVFCASNQMISCNVMEGLFMCCVLQYRGNIRPKDVNAAIFEIKRRQDIKFVDWCPTGFKLGITSQPCVYVPGSEMAQTERSLTMISNTTSIQEPLDSLMRKFDILLNKRSFVHWFVGEGMEEGEFIEARDEMCNLILDFSELANQEDDENEENVPQKTEEVPKEAKNNEDKPASTSEEDVKSDIKIQIKKSKSDEAKSESVNKKSESDSEASEKDLKSDDSENESEDSESES